VRVILVRHAKAEQGHPDGLRPLTPAGREKAEELGRQLADERPDAVVSSPLVRAVQTATPIAKAAGVELELEERLSPGATADDLRAVVEGRGETVVVVGHQPDCSEIVLELTGDDVQFKTGATFTVEL
jgi:phosphohistidine phosphatase SixA